MTDHNGVLVMQRLLLAGTLGLTMARKAAAILEGESGSLGSGAASLGSGAASLGSGAASLGSEPGAGLPLADGTEPDISKLREGAVLRAILDAANECLGYFDDRPPGDRWCDALFQLLDLAAFAADLDSAA